MRKLYEIFKVLTIQKRIETIRGNTVPNYVVAVTTVLCSLCGLKSFQSCFNFDFCYIFKIGNLGRRRWPILDFENDSENEPKGGSLNSQSSPPKKIKYQ
jgi:hypothetical protein